MEQNSDQDNAVPTDREVTRIVGIGASAGGLEALRSLIESLPDAGTLSYIIALHVSPIHVSMLKGLLSPLTTLKVVDLADDQTPLPGYVYITPPNHDVIASDGVLRLTPPSAPVGPKPSVNHFFASLANEYGERVIGIILSDTGSDGAAGMRAIKAAGGITIAQELASAKYDSMPKSAVLTGSVDLVLTPAQMADFLENIAKYPDDDYRELEFSDVGDDYRQICNIVRLNAAFKLSDYKQTTIKRRIARRMHLLRIDELSQYVEYLKQNREESQRLMRDVFIGVTSFYRDVEAYSQLEKYICELVKRQEKEMIRCWVAGCSTGEEVYSIAMLFEEAISTHGNSAVQYMIFASDMDEESLAHARVGMYTASEVAGIPKALRDRYMELSTDRYRIKKNIRNRVVFIRQNIIEAPPFGRVDLVSCRNFLIYLNAPVQNRVIEMFHYALNPDGYLFLGKSESIEQNSELFKSLERSARIYQRLEASSHFSIGQYASRTLIENKKDNTRAHALANTDMVSMRTQSELIARYAPPSVVINADDWVVHMQGELRALLDFPKGRVEMYLFDLVNSALRAELRALVFRCRRDLMQVQGEGHQLVIKGEPYTVTQAVSPLEEGQRALLLVVFQLEHVLSKADAATDLSAADRSSLIIGELEQELANTRMHLSTVVEELEASNEELQSLKGEMQSTNEELQSTNEELQTANEELQSTNEELLTVNDELQLRSTELEVASTALNNIKESLTMPLMVVDRHLRITHANKACSAIMTMLSTLEGSSINTVPWQVQIIGLADKIEQVINSSNPICEVLSDASGNYFTLTVMPYCLVQGDAVGAILVFENITARHLAEQAVIESETRYRQVAESLPQLVWTCRADGYCDYLSPQWVEYTGVPEDEQLNFGWLEQIHPDDRERVIDHWMKTAAQGYDFEIEFRIRRSDGLYRWFHTQAKPLRNHEGAIVKWFGSNTDIEHIKQTEIQLRENIERVEAAASAGIVGIWEWNVTDDILIWDSVMYKIYGIHEDNWGRAYEAWSTRIHPEDKVYVEGEIQAALRGQREYAPEFRIVMSNGEIRFLKAASHTCFDEQGNPSRMIGINLDQTEQKRTEEALRQAEARVSRVIDVMPEAVMVISQQGEIRQVNQRATLMFGYDRAALMQMRVEQLVPQQYRGNHAQLRAEFSQDPSMRLMGTGRDLFALHKSGREIPVEIAMAPMYEGGEHSVVISVADITERKQAEHELRLAASVFANTLDGIVVTDRNLNVIKSNEAFHKILGYTSAEIAGQNVRILSADQQDGVFQQKVWESIKEKGGWQGEVLDRHKDGRKIPIWLSISTIQNAKGEVDRYIATMYDISDQKLSQERINYLAHYDALTGLPNRTLFMDRFAHALSQAKRQKHSLVLMFIDLDNFKHINDTYGHPVGDDLLCKVAERLRRVTRSSDTVGRQSGDEFMVLIEDAMSESAIRSTAQNVLNELIKPLDLGVGNMFVSASIGIATFPGDGDNIESLLKHADLAMYKAKETGRNKFHFYNQDMSDEAHERMQLHHDLHLALDANELELHYQPVMQTASQTCAWVLRTACKQMKSWLDAGIALDFMAVNVSGKQVMQGDFTSLVKDILEETGCPPERITLELTESFIMREREGAIAQLNLLRDLGVGIAIDDFGTGYSSLAYLKRLPVTKIKLDQSFVRDIPGDSNDIAIARAILKLGEAVELDVVAEGVETDEQHSFLLQEGCAYSQGYLYAKPMPSIEAYNFMRACRA